MAHSTLAISHVDHLVDARVVHQEELTIATTQADSAALAALNLNRTPENRFPIRILKFQNASPLTRGKLRAPLGRKQAHQLASDVNLYALAAKVLDRNACATGTLALASEGCRQRQGSRHK
jgi:hypothetical protein